MWDGTGIGCIIVVIRGGCRRGVHATAAASWRGVQNAAAGRYNRLDVCRVGGCGERLGESVGRGQGWWGNRGGC